MLKVELKILTISYEKDGIFFVYAPQLDICGYDKSLELAKKSFDITIKEYFLYAIKNGTLYNDLKKHGWRQINDKLKPPTNKSWEAKLKNIKFSQKQQKFDVEIDKI